MAKKPDGSGDFEPISAGNHQGVCYRYYDLGTQHSELFGKDIHKVLIIWEIPGERIEIEGESRPRVISKEYSLSLHKKANLRQDLEAWRAKPFTDEELEGFNLDKILRINALVNVSHNTKDDRTYANVASLSPLMKTMQKLQPENEVFGWSFTNDGPDQLPGDTPEWILKKIHSSLEWQSYSSEPTGQYEESPQEPSYHPEDEIPF